MIATTRSEDRKREIADFIGPEAQTAALTISIVPTIAIETTQALIEPDSVVVVSVPPQGSTGESERAVATACAQANARRLVYLSTTGVYGSGTDEWVGEDSPLEPLGERGQRRLAAERAIGEVADRENLSVVSLRIAGIYSADRGVIARMRAGTYRVYGDGTSWVSRVHVDDLVSAIEGAGRMEPSQHSAINRAFNIADDEPVGSRLFADEIAKKLGLPAALTVPLSEASANARAMLAANRRVSNALAKRAFGWTLRYPTWRDGLASVS